MEKEKDEDRAVRSFWAVYRSVTGRLLFMMLLPVALPAWAMVTVVRAWRGGKGRGRGR